MVDESKYQVLFKVNSPKDIRTLTVAELKTLCAEVREYMVDVISQVGGHFGGGLGTVELTVALHKVFDTPNDLIVWDTGHQAYPHKILTGRRDQLNTIRQLNGLSGFLKRSESEYDAFGAGHATTSVSAALGMAEGSKQQGTNKKVIAVIGDGAMTGGMAYEAMNNAGVKNSNLIVILNDNRMSIAPNVWQIHNYFNEMIAHPEYNKFKGAVWDLTGKLDQFGDRIRKVASRLERGIKSVITPGILFEALGFRYFGPINAHNLVQLIKIFEHIKNLNGPILVHVLSEKGKGYTLAEEHAVTFAAGLATQGVIPVVAIYSTFLQRGFDQIIHDVALQKLHVVFVLDRAGLVGADGPTHHGSFDLSYLRLIPGMVIMSPKDESELRDMLYTAIMYKKGPIVLRYPRGSALGVPVKERFDLIEIGKSEILEDGNDVAFLALGSMVNYAQKASKLLSENSISCELINMRFAKPLDTQRLDDIANKFKKIVTLEENSLAGGFGSAVSEYFADKKYKNDLLRIGLPDYFIDHGTQEELHKLIGIDPQSIAEKVKLYCNTKDFTEEVIVNGSN